MAGMAAKMFVIAGPVLVYGLTASVVYGVLLVLLGSAGYSIVSGRLLRPPPITPESTLRRFPSRLSSRRFSAIIR